MNTETARPAAGPMIEVAGLTKRFGSLAALDAASLSVPRGTVYGLVGPNGAGKTTLIRHIAGVMRPNEGSVLVDGAPVWENAALKERMALIPDSVYFFPQANILDMMRFYSGIYPRFDRARFEWLKGVFPLDLRRPLKRFSRGMQKQAALWLALCCCPDLILLDEPVDGLDPVMRRTVWNLVLQDVAQRGTTVFVSSHNLRELEDVCTHVAIMHAGRVVLQRDLAALQGELLKIQVAFPGEPPAGMNALEALHVARRGRVLEYIIRGTERETLARVQALQPLLVDVLPLSLEEIFIYELGGMGYAEIIV